MPNKKGLFLSVGGVNGGYLVGFLSHLHDNENELKYDTYSGISIGAIIAAHMKAHRNEPQNGIPKLKERIVDFNAEQLTYPMYENMIARVLYTILFNLSAFSANGKLESNVKNLVGGEKDSTSNFDRLKTPDSTLYVGCQNYDTGKYTIFTNKETDLRQLFHHDFEKVVCLDNGEQLIKAIVSSAALFPLFEPVKIETDNVNMTAIDGGFKHCIPVTEIKQFITNELEKKNNVKCDILVCHPLVTPQSHQTKLDYFFRFLTESQNIIERTGDHAMERDVCELKEFMHKLGFSHDDVEQWGKTKFTLSNPQKGITVRLFCVPDVYKDTEKTYVDRYCEFHKNTGIHNFNSNSVQRMMEDAQDIGKHITNTHSAEKKLNLIF